MEAIRLPADTAFPSFRVTLDDAEYTLAFAWNQREAKWYFSLSDNEESLILSGVKVVADFDLLSRCRHDDRCPPGRLFALDTTGQGLDPHFSEMAGLEPRVVLIYLTAADLG